MPCFPPATGRWLWQCNSRWNCQPCVQVTVWAICRRKSWGSRGRGESWGAANTESRRRARRDDQRSNEAVDVHRRATQAVPAGEGLYGEAFFYNSGSLSSFFEPYSTIFKQYLNKKQQTLVSKHLRRPSTPDWPRYPITCHSGRPRHQWNRVTHGWWRFCLCTALTLGSLETVMMLMVTQTTLSEMWTTCVKC